MGETGEAGRRRCWGRRDAEEAARREIEPVGGDGRRRELEVEVAHPHRIRRQVRPRGAQWQRAK